jgi:hypothetical protein
MQVVSNDRALAKSTQMARQRIKARIVHLILNGHSSTINATNKIPLTIVRTMLETPNLTSKPEFRIDHPASGKRLGGNSGAKGLSMVEMAACRLTRVDDVLEMLDARIYFLVGQLAYLGRHAAIAGGAIHVQRVNGGLPIASIQNSVCRCNAGRFTCPAPHHVYQRGHSLLGVVPRQFRKCRPLALGCSVKSALRSARAWAFATSGHLAPLISI